MKNDPTETPRLRVTHADRKRLSPHLTGWNAVCTMLAANLISEEDLRRLALIEAETRKRKPIIEKLVGCYLSKVRQRIIQEMIDEKFAAQLFKLAKTKTQQNKTS